MINVLNISSLAKQKPCPLVQFYFTLTFALRQNLSGHLEAPADVGVVGL